MFLHIHHMNCLFKTIRLYFSVPCITQAPSTDYRILFIYELLLFFCCFPANRCIINHITHIEVALCLKPTLPCSAK